MMSASLYTSKVPLLAFFRVSALSYESHDSRDRSHYKKGNLTVRDQ